MNSTINCFAKLFSLKGRNIIFLREDCSSGLTKTFDVNFVSFRFHQHTSHQHGQAGEREFKLRGTNCYSENDGPFDSTQKLTLKANTRQTIFIDIDENNKMFAILVSRTIILNSCWTIYWTNIFKCMFCLRLWIAFLFEIIVNKQQFYFSFRRITFSLVLV